MSNPSQETLPQMPPHLAERLQHDQEQFEKQLSLFIYNDEESALHADPPHPPPVSCALTQDQLTESLTSASERHEQVLQAKQMDAHQEVARAMEIAASHESKPEDNVPGRTLHSEGDKLIPLESSVEAK
ncbi:hypothetical protein JCM16303_006914 [Sporobolomyces ruberrimus]